MGADFFNVYLAVSDNTNEISRINSALKNNRYKMECKYLIKYENQDLAVERMTSSRTETNGLIDISREKDGPNSGNDANTDVSGSDEKVEDKDSFELENER